MAPTFTLGADLSDVPVIRLTAAHFRTLRSLARQVSGAPDLTAAAALIEDDLSRLLGEPVWLVQEALEPAEGPTPAPLPPGDRWPTRPAAARPRSEVSSDARAAFFGDQTPPEPTPPQPTARPPGSRESTVPPRAAVATAPDDHLAVPLGVFGGRAWTLMLPDRWTSPRQRRFIAEVRETLPAALSGPEARSRLAHAERVVAATFSFSRQLTNVRGAGALRQFIVDTLADATHARLGSLALYNVEEGTLHIAATHGYPSLLVEHVRVAPGESIIGRVFETRRPLLVRDISDAAGLHARRPRYRTSSFLAVPLLADPDVLGVVAVTDRLDEQPFDEGDLTAARALAAPAALALLNDRLTAQTRELAHAATVDPLTGLFNRRYFHTRIEEELERSRRYSVDLSLLLIDVDDFKQLNDSLGHLAGDYVLRQIGEVLKRSVRVFDVCTRYGGEEFAILMPGSGEASAMVVAERIRSRVEAASREEGPLPPHLRITVSLGLAVLGADTTSQELIARADRALYRAKAGGKNRVVRD